MRNNSRGGSLERDLAVVQGPVSTFGSSTVASYSSVSRSRSRQRSTWCKASDEIRPPVAWKPDLAVESDHVTTTNVSPSQRPAESPKKDGTISLGCGCHPR